MFFCVYKVYVLICIYVCVWFSVAVVCVKCCLVDDACAIACV